MEPTEILSDGCVHKPPHIPQISHCLPSTGDSGNNTHQHLCRVQLLVGKEGGESTGKQALAVEKASREELVEESFRQKGQGVLILRGADGLGVLCNGEEWAGS